MMSTAVGGPGTAARAIARFKATTGVRVSYGIWFDFLRRHQAGHRSRGREYVGWVVSEFMACGDEGVNERRPPRWTGPVRDRNGERSA